MRRFILTTLAVLFFPVFGHADICSDLVAAFPKLVGGKPLVSSVTHSSYKSLFDNCDSHDQFAGHKLPSHNGKQLKCSNDPNHVGYLLKYSDGTISFSAKAGVDADGSKFSCGA